MHNQDLYPNIKLTIKEWKLIIESLSYIVTEPCLTTEKFNLMYNLYSYLFKIVIQGEEPSNE